MSIIISGKNLRIFLAMMSMFGSCTPLSRQMWRGVSPTEPRWDNLQHTNLVFSSCLSFSGGPFSSSTHPGETLGFLREFNYMYCYVEEHEDIWHRTYKYENTKIENRYFKPTSDIFSTYKVCAFQIKRGYFTCEIISPTTVQTLEHWYSP
mgnify:CR=1 FL=1